MTYENPVVLEILVGLICVAFWYWRTKSAVKRAEEEPMPPRFYLAEEWRKEKEEETK